MDVNCLQSPQYNPVTHFPLLWPSPRPSENVNQPMAKDRPGSGQVSTKLPGLPEYHQDRSDACHIGTDRIEPHKQIKTCLHVHCSGQADKRLKES